MNGPEVMRAGLTKLLKRGRELCRKDIPEEEWQAHRERANRLLDEIIFEGDEDLPPLEGHPGVLPALVADLALSTGLPRLKRMADDPDFPDVTWDRPLVEIQSPVPWDWKQQDRLPPAWFLRPSDCADLSSLLAVLTSALFVNLRAELFSSASTGATITMDNGHVMKIEWPNPFSKRTGPWRLSGANDEPLRMTFERKSGTRAEVSLAVEVHHLTLIEDEQRAFVPVTVGLNIEWATEEGSPSLDEEERAQVMEWAKGVLKTLRGETPPESLVDRREIATTHSLQASAGALSLAGQAAEIGGGSGAKVVAGDLSRRYLFDGGRYRRDSTTAQAVQLIDAGAPLPKKLARIPRWEDLEEAEVKRLLDAEGGDAFRDRRQEGGPPPLLKQEKLPGGQTGQISLRAHARTSLEERNNRVGWRKFVKDPDGRTRDYLIRKCGGVEIRLSWYDLAWPLVGDGTTRGRAELEQRRAECQNNMFEDPDGKVRKQIEQQMEWLGALDDARKMMGYVLNVFARDGTNPVRIPAHELRILLENEKAEDGMARIRGGLRALQELRFSAKGPGMQVFGPLLGSVAYRARGRGEATDGEFYVEVSEEGVGCLQAYGTKRYKIRDGHRLNLYDWRQNADLEGGRYLTGWSTLRPFFDKAKGLSSSQQSLLDWIEAEITLAKDPPSQKQVRGAAGMEPRFYRHDFCPLLEQGRDYVGALGHFRQNPEVGRRMAGTESTGKKRADGTASGGKTAGLLEAAFRVELPRGKGWRGREKVVNKALQDLVAVVNEALGGVVAGRHDGRWLSLPEASKTLTVQQLAHEVRWMIFLPASWRDQYREIIEAHHEDRRKRGETPWDVKVTQDRKTYELGDSVRRGETVENGTLTADGQCLPIRNRLLARRRELGLSQAATGALFGVSQQTVALWEAGTEAQVEGGSRGKPIPGELAPMILRWIESGVVPTAEELATRKTARGKGLRRDESE